MKKSISYLVLFLGLIFLLIGCGANSTIVAELSPMGQLNPFSPGIIGGCLVDAADDVELEVTYENGKCTVKTTSPQTFSPNAGRTE